MIEVIEFVAASDGVEAKLRHKAGLSRETQREAEMDADTRNVTDKCNPPCHYTVWRVTTTVEHM